MTRGNKHGGGPADFGQRKEQAAQAVAFLTRPFQGYLDFSRPIVAVSGEAIRKGRAAYPPQVPLKIKMAAGWPAQSLQGMIVDSLDAPLPIQATPEERERFDLR